MSSSEYYEINFMINYFLTTLLSLYERFNLSKRMRLRIIDKDLEISGDAIEILRALDVLSELSHAVKLALRRLQALMSEELTLVEAGPLLGKPVTSLAAKYLPTSMPARVTKLSFETPANLLLTATVAEVASQLKGVERRLCEAQRANGNPLIDFAIERVRMMISQCDYLLSEPALKPLVRKAEMVARDERALRELENRVRADAARKPREYRAYYHLLKLRERLRASVQALRRYLEGDTLVLRILPSKLYELYGFSLLLEALLETIGTGPLQVDIDYDERKEREILVLRRDGLHIHVSFNSLPEGVESKLATARAYGLLADSIDQALVRKLGGIPDTIVTIETGGKRKKLMVVDYKYTRRLNYLVASRFKALSYLYEYSADCAVIVVPKVEPENRDFDDEEEREHLGFYESLIARGGAIIEINSNSKLLAIVLADPNEVGARNAKTALKKLFSLLLSDLN